MLNDLAFKTFQINKGCWFSMAFVVLYNIRNKQQIYNVQMNKDKSFITQCQRQRKMI